MRTRAWIGLPVLALLGLQIFQPGSPRPTLQGDGPMSRYVVTPPAVEAVLRTACYDCHSPETRWPWYSNVSPFSWWIVGHVEHGRSNLDFSSWSIDPIREPTPEQRLRWTCEEVRDGFMPPPSYLLAHSEARLTPAQKDLICAWTAAALAALTNRHPPLH